MLYALHPSIIGKLLTVDNFHKIVSKHIKHNLPVKMRKTTADDTKIGRVYMGGTYYSGNDFAKKQAIEIVLSYNPADSHVNLNKYRWLRLCMLFADTVLHEIIHMRQYRARNFKSLPGYNSISECAKQRSEQIYYGDRDEMGAFSFNIACELTDRFGTDYNAAAEYLDSNKYKKHKNSTWASYMKTFDNNHSHHVIRTMKRKIIRMLPYGAEGKPFKTSNWLTY
jgi:hypothetical protein